ncbi:MAG: hypothetical protein JXD22_11580 [Sedimentisphaerales bacterium]|nr:hypothetical protein [Sedimentisphaerales bacterium]
MNTEPIASLIDVDCPICLGRGWNWNVQTEPESEQQADVMSYLTGGQTDSEKKTCILCRGKGIVKQWQHRIPITEYKGHGSYRQGKFCTG